MLCMYVTVCVKYANKFNKKKIPGKETKNSYSVLKVVLRDEVGNLCQVQSILL